MTDAEVLELMVRRRRQLLIHSYIYYGRGTSLISDRQWDRWARELERLNAEYPVLAGTGDFAGAFHKFTSASGYYLSYQSGWVVRAAEHLLMIAKEYEDEYCTNGD